MKSTNDSEFWLCPFCNGSLPLSQDYCPSCSDSISDSTYDTVIDYEDYMDGSSSMDGIDDPTMSDLEYQESFEREFGAKKALTISWRALVGLVLITLFVLSLGK